MAAAVRVSAIFGRASGAAMGRITAGRLGESQRVPTPCHWGEGVEGKGRVRPPLPGPPAADELFRQDRTL